MRLYRYRWFCAIVCALVVLLVGYVADLQSIIEEHAALVASESDMQEQINLHQSVGVPSHQEILDSVNQRSILLRELLNLVDLSNMALLSFTQAKQDEEGGVDAEYYQLVLSAEYPSFMFFLQQLADPPGKYTVGNFTITASDGNQVQVSLMLRVVNGIVGEHADLPATKKATSPFCMPLERILTQQVVHDEAVKFSLEDLRLLGAVSYAETRGAVILFPDGVISVVANQSLLGSEGGKISALNKSSLEVTLPDRSRRVLRVSQS